MTRKLVIGLLAVAALSCSPRITMPLAQTQADSVQAVRTDSVIVRDSIYIDRETVIREKGNTVYITRTDIRYKDRWRERVKTDTLYVDRLITETVTEYRNRELTKWQTFCMSLGKYSLVFLIALAVVLVARFLMKRKGIIK